MTAKKALNKIRDSFSNPEAVKLLKPYWREQNKKSGIPSTGFCYLGVEAIFHAIGGVKSNFRPKYLKEGIETHWWLQDDNGTIIDPTADQYGDTPIPYEKGIGAGFMNGYEKPSARTKKLLEISEIEITNGKSRARL